MKVIDLFMNTCVDAHDIIAVNCDDFECSYSELKEHVDSFSEILKTNGIKEKEKVGIVTNDPVDFLVAFFSVCSIGAIVIPIHHDIGNDRIVRIQKEYKLNHYIFGGGVDLKIDCNTNHSFKMLSRTFNHLVILENSYDLILSDVRMILFTSGTTSTPKAIMLTDANIVSNVKSISAYLSLNDSDKLLLIKNMNHSSSIVGEMLVGVFNKCSLIFTRKLPNSKVIMNLISEKGVNVFFAVPALLIAMIESNSFENYDLSSLRIINFYGASTSKDYLSLIYKKFDKSRIIYSYGLSEASPRVTYIDDERLLNKIGSSGKAIRDVHVRIIDSNGREVEPNKVGEIVVSGPNIMKGYYRNNKLTKNTIKQNELYTKDLGYKDLDGFLYVTGRKDNMIITAGKNLYPEEIENTLTSIPDVLEALVKGVTKKNGIVELEYNILLKKNSKLTESDVFNYCRNNLENYKLPKTINFVESFDKTISGKIKR